MSMDEPRVYEIRIQGCASTEEALALQEPVARVLCREAEHDGPCDIPWEFTLGAGDGDAVLVVGVYTTSGPATEAADQVRGVAGEGRHVELGEGDPEIFEALVEQYRFESRSPRT